ncbi:hypothetical protein [Clostridium beijerinckii]|uniref:Uncharacterized protein n=1 Tax=Clostridium beijerinckii TaxID=1520 RepID=A0AAX0AXS7_CLOBE|nr:hypothetical protein [Clostridium beijerinckii]NRT87273.1 hypothetical protein [Clostridium beijerinckii]NYC72704.1 hypothetical protein [Clostridium beijerinckii]
MKKKLLTKLCALSVLGCTLLSANPVFAYTYLAESITGHKDTSEVELGSGTRFFCGLTYTLGSVTAKAYQDIDWSPDKKVATIYPKGNGGFDRQDFTAEEGSKYYGTLVAPMSNRATLSFTD